jgi:hypothetical protein
VKALSEGDFSGEAAFFSDRPGFQKVTVTVVGRIGKTS